MSRHGGIRTCGRCGCSWASSTLQSASRRGNDHRRQGDQASVDPQDAGPSVAGRRGAGHRPRRGRVGVDRARAEAAGWLRRPGRGQRRPRPSRDRRVDRRADRAPGLLPDHAAVLQPAGGRAGDQARVADAGRSRLHDVRGQRLGGPRGRPAEGGGAPGDLDYTMFAVSGSEANERAMQMARHYWLAKGKPGKYKIISLTGGYHGATAGTYAICGLPHMVEAYAPLQVPGFAKVTPPYPYRDRGTGTDAELVQRRGGGGGETIEREGADTVSAVIMEPVISSGGFIMPPLGWMRAVRALGDARAVVRVGQE